MSVDGRWQMKVRLLIYISRKAVSIAECFCAGLVRDDCLNRSVPNPRDARPVPGHRSHYYTDMLNLTR